jgi:hypothetical protein
MISFEEASRHGQGRYLKVKLTTKIGRHDFEGEGTDSRTLVVTIGRIESSRDGMFRYFEPKTHELNPLLVDKDLKTLKKRIKVHRKGLTPRYTHKESIRGSRESCTSPVEPMRKRIIAVRVK